MYAIKFSRPDMACVKIHRGRYEISIAFDDSCGSQVNLVRGDIRVYGSDGYKQDVTHAFSVAGDDLIPADIDTLMRIIKQIDTEDKPV